ncbi:hypothetical protein ABET52_11790 [Saccharococcus caldoxylosilyticus]|uniref:hypothetical protein n=1 Tax=Saccharococcus caldoxylosilyticus TaxID=81408 RepID=UPI001C4DF39A|nr:hypothetical protein [Parageobacillus caldoxylosilyticus]QXJ40320.1 hypothetical protein BV455_03693 [Parageobacillus caldoxylosilyticus]
MAMKKFFAIWMIAGLCSLGAYFFVTASSKPPALDISAAGKKIPVTRGSYCWKTFFSAKCVDWAYAPPWKIGDVHEPVEVEPHSEIEIDFEKEPVSLAVEQWINEGKAKNIKVKNKKITAPSESGVYVYHLMVNWKQGDGNYVFHIKVK